jgi:hypothetical protein
MVGMKRVSDELYRGGFLQFRTNKGERDVLDKYAKINEVGVREFGGFYRGIIVELARMGIEKAKVAK